VPLIRTSLILVTLAACGSFKGKVTTSVTELAVESRATPGGFCNVFPLDHTFTLDEMSGGQTARLGENLKVCEVKWRIEAEALNLDPSPGCEVPSGTVSFNTLVLEYPDDAGANQQVVVDCPLMAWSFSSKEALQGIVNGCFNSLTGSQASAVVKAFSTKTKRMRIFSNTSCAADGCFSADWVVRAYLDEATVILGDCPK
jgi:hypothetical protein